MNALSAPLLSTSSLRPVTPAAAAPGATAAGSFAALLTIVASAPVDGVSLPRGQGVADPGGDLPGAGADGGAPTRVTARSGIAANPVAASLTVAAPPSRTADAIMTASHDVVPQLRVAGTISPTPPQPVTLTPSLSGTSAAIRGTDVDADADADANADEDASAVDDVASAALPSILIVAQPAMPSPPAPPPVETVALTARPSTMPVPTSATGAAPASAAQGPADTAVVSAAAPPSVGSQPATSIAGAIALAATAGSRATTSFATIPPAGTPTPGAAAVPAPAPPATPDTLAAALPMTVAAGAPPLPPATPPVPSGTPMPSPTAPTSPAPTRSTSSGRTTEQTALPPQPAPPASWPAAVRSLRPGDSAPAAQLFAAAIRSADAPARATERDALPADLSAIVGLAPPVAAAAATGERQPSLDLHRHDWPQQMIEHIETLRDAADAGSTRIRVSPDALGGIDVSLHRQGDGTVQVALAADRAQTQSLIADARPELTRLGEARGLRFADGAAGQGGGGASAGQSGTPPPRRPGRPAAAAAAGTLAVSDASDGRVA